MGGFVRDPFKKLENKALKGKSHYIENLWKKLLSGQCQKNNWQNFLKKFRNNQTLKRLPSSSLVEELDQSKEIQIPPKTSQDRLFEDFVEDSVQLVASQYACNLPRRKRRRRIREKITRQG